MSPTSTLISLSLMAVVSGDAMAASYYVSATNGNDNNNGSINAPWRYINTAVNKSVLAGGDTIYIRGGTYYERVSMYKSGSSSSRITVTNYSGETPTIDGSGQSTTYEGRGIFEIRSSNVTVNGLKLMNATWDTAAMGVYVRGPGISNVTVQNCTTYNTKSSGIAVWGNTSANDYSGCVSIVVSGNNISKALVGGYNEALTITDGVDWFYVGWNTIHDSYDSDTVGNIPLSIDAKRNVRNGNIYGNNIYNMGNCGGIYVDGYDRTAYNINIYGNQIKTTKHSGIAVGAEQGGSSQYVNIYNNLVTSNPEHGIVIWGSDTNNLHHINVYNNTVASNSWYGCYAYGSRPYSIVIKNNIFSQNGWGNGVTLLTASKGNYDVSNNITNGVFNAWLSGYECYAGNSANYNDPVFAWAANGNYRLQASSPANNWATSSLVPSVDLDGNARPKNGGYDAGCYERQ